MEGVHWSVWNRVYPVEWCLWNANLAKIKMDPAREPIRVNRYFFLKKCCPDIHKLNFTSNTKLSSHSIEEWTALINFKNRNDFIIKAANKSGATVICRIELYQKEAVFGPVFLHQRQQKPPANLKIVKDTIQELKTKQELPITQNLIITTPTTSCI